MDSRDAPWFIPPLFWIPVFWRRAPDRDN
jgi:hypothetical protein